MSACYCDYDEYPSLYKAKMVRAAKEHRCHECRRPILAGEQYESVFAIWGGDAGAFKTCGHCVSLREWTKAHVPCTCWAHGNLINDLSSAIEEFWIQTVGLKFGYMRRLVQINRLGGIVSYNPYSD